MVDENVISETFIIGWYDKAKGFKLDKDSATRHKKAEEKFKEVIPDFVEWLKKTEYEEASGGEEETE